MEEKEKVPKNKSVDRDIEEIDEQKTWEGTRKRKRKKSQESNGVVKARKKNVENNSES